MKLLSKNLFSIGEKVFLMESLKGLRTSIHMQARAVLATLLFLFGVQQSQAQILISGYMGNPASTDGNFEYVQLIATQAIDFSVTPYSMVVSNNGTATANGWVNGLAISYKFDITSGAVAAGQTFYVGGSGKLVAGAGSTDISSLTWIKTISVATTPGDGFGSLNTGGVLGNGGANADGIGIFSGTTLTASSVPIDAIFYGTAVGGAFSSPNGYTVPTNDRYSNTQGLFGQGTNTFLFTDIGTGNTYVSLGGTYNTITSTWTTPRTGTGTVLTTTSPISAIDPTLTVVLPTPEINVKGNGVTITDGDVTPSTTDDTDFGVVTVGNSLNKTYTIENLGAATLNISNITLTGTHSAEYTLVSPPTFPLAISGGGSQTITVQFTPTVSTLRSATLNIFSDDTNEATYDIALQGGFNPIPYTLSFVRTNQSRSEGSTSTTVALKVTSVGNVAGSIDLAVVAASTAQDPADYTVSAITANVPATLVLNDTVFFTLNLVDDAAAEADEYIICKLANAVNVTIGSTSQSTVYITDNDKTVPAATNQISLSLLGSFSNGTAFSGPTQINSAEISAFDSASKRVFIANSIGSKLDIVNFANPAAPTLVSSLSVTPYGAINSVAAKNGIIALAIENGTNKQLAGKVVFLDANGTLIDSVTVGVMPDMLVFNHAGTKVYTANEGEPNDAYTTDPEGSVSVVDITTLLTTGITTAANVTNIGFTAYNGQETTLRAQGIRIFGTGASAAQDFEPEYITISDDDTKAWVSLQENNALAELNLTTNTITQLIPLGYKDHSLVANALDASDQTAAVNLANFPIKGMYLPDAIASYTSGGNVYVLTANEGDARAYTGMNEETRVGSMNLDLAVFPNAAELKNNLVLGRLRTTNKLGDTDNDGDFDEIYAFGARSFSVWNTSTSSLIYDSGDELERITANDPTYSTYFNFNSGGVRKDRSDDKGPEAEGVAVGKINGIPYAFVGMERTGGVVVYNINTPATPSYVTYANNRPTDVSPEGIVFVPATQSPNGKNLLILSNEISSTLTIYQVNPCLATGIAAISAAGSTTFCPGSSVQLAIVTPNGSYSYQWLKDNVAISAATASSYTASTAGDYKLAVVNSMGCVDTSAVITVTIPADVTNPTITAPATVSVCVNNGCTAAGVNLGTPTTADDCSVASVTNNAPATFPLGNTTVTWTVTDGSGNTATATQTVTVTDGINPTVYLSQDNLVAGVTGPSSSKTPYLVPSANGVKLTSILSVDDAISGYAMAGLADGLGAYDNCDGTFTLLMAHEIGSTLGVTRAHGSKGSFVSKWLINKSNLSVVSGSDLIQQAYLWNTTTSSYDLAAANAAAFSRFCSADLPAVSAFYNGATGLGTKERIFMNGEENGNVGRAFAHIVTGTNAGKSYELPRLGKAGWENSVASPVASNTTIVAELDDNTTDGQVYFYIGTKTNTGSEIDQAGLTNGNLYAVAVTGLLAESRTTPPTAGTAFSLVNLGDVSSLTGAQLNTNTLAANATSFLRPEDGAWDPSNPNDFYFATTDRIDNVKDGNGAQEGRSRLYRLRFTDIQTPLLGGTIEAVLDGTEAQNMMDNLSIDKFGHVFLQEDPGNAPHNAKIWQYTIATDQLTEIAKHDPARFGDIGVPATAPYNLDEESSGIIDVSDILGAGMHIFVDQGHYTTGISAQSVEGGQLLAMFIPSAVSATASTAADTVIAYATSNCTATSVNLGTPASGDNCSVASLTNNAPTTYPLGNTTVTWTATDGSNNTTTAIQIVTVLDTIKPAIAVTGTLTFCEGDSVTLSVANQGGNTYQWYESGNVIQNATSNTYIAKASGSYTVRESNGTCNRISLAKVATELPIPAAPTITSTTTTACVGANVTLTGAGAGATATEYAWFRNGTFVNYSNTSADYTFAAASGSNDYTLVVIYSGGCTSSLSATTTIVGNAPVAVITPSSTPPYCVGAAPSLNATPPTGTGYTYSWIGTSPTASTSATAMFTPTNSGNHRVIVTDVNGCSKSSAWSSIVLNALPNANAGTDKNLCVNSNTTLGTSSVIGYSYSWSPSTNLSSASIYNPTVTPTAVGSITYTLTTTRNGCSKTDQVIVAASANPTTPTLSSTSSPVCQGASITLIPSGYTGAINWYKNGVLTKAAPTAAHLTLTAPGGSQDSYTIRAKNGSCLSVPSNAVAAWIKPAPTPTISATPAATNYLVTICNPGQTTGTANLQVATPSGAPIVSAYNWQQVVSGVATNVSPAATTSTYTASVATVPSSQNNKIFRAEVTYTNACVKNTTTMKVQLLPSTCTGRTAEMDNLTEVLFTAYPNPTENVLTVSIQNSKVSEGDLVLYNTLGQVITFRTISLSNGSTEESLDLSGLASGIYTLSLQTKDGNQVQKIVKE